MFVLNLILIFNTYSIPIAIALIGGCLCLWHYDYMVL